MVSLSGEVLATAPLPPRTDYRAVVTPDGHDLSPRRSTQVRFTAPWPDGAVALEIAGQRLPVETTTGRQLVAPAGVEEIHVTGPSSRRLDLVILADGFTETERPAFDAAVGRVTAHLSRLEPYNQYGDLLNVWKVFTPGPMSGVDQGEGVGAVDTPFECHYGCDGIDRLVCCNEDLINIALQTSVPFAEGVLVLVNDEGHYGGSGGYDYAAAYIGSEGAAVAAHELAHSLVLLWDEYDYGEDSDADRKFISPNCAPTGKPLPWQSWIGDEHPDIGTYPGCSFHDWVRPTPGGCMMYALQDRYCPVCREHIVRKMYEAVGGPVESVEPPADEKIRLSAGESKVFSAVALAPRTGLEWEWTLDGELVSTEPDAFTLDGCGNHRELQLTVRDPTPWVRNDPDGSMESTVVWKNLRTERCEGDPVRCGCQHGPRPEALLALLALGLRRRRG